MSIEKTSVSPVAAAQWASAAMEQRLVRYRDLRPCRNAFVDTYTPGSSQKENFTIIGPGVAEHPDQYVHIREPHGFNIGGARQSPGCLNSQHSHVTGEVFIVHQGQWAFRWGDKGQDGETLLGPGDCISIPVNVFRGFENVGDDLGYLFAVLGQDDPGHVTWAPDVFKKAKDFGLVLLENGRLVDTTRGEKIPPGLSAQAPTSPEQVAAHRVMSAQEMLACVVAGPQQRDEADSLLTRGVDGVRESPLIGSANRSEQIASGKLAWRHGFNLRRLDLAAGAVLPFHSRSEEEVIFLHYGRLQFTWPDGELDIASGDVLTVPIGLAHGFENPGTDETVVYVVRGGDVPSAPDFN